MLEAMVVCLATAIYFEARGEPRVGQQAVAHVVLNRVRDPRFPSNVCDVVEQGPRYKWNPDIPVKHRCQFSYYCDGKSDEPKDKKAYKRAYNIALRAIAGGSDDPTEGATHYHAHYVYPEWGTHERRVVRINDHIFYKWERPDG